MRIGMGKLGKVLDTVKEGILDGEAVKMVEDRGRFQRNVQICRGICGLPRPASRFLGMFLSTALNDRCPAVVCMGCGTVAEKGNAWNTRSPMDILLEVSRTNDRIKTFIRGLLHATPPNVKPRREVILKNGLCLQCGRKLGRIIPEIYRIRLEERAENKPVPGLRTGSVEDAVLHLQRHNVIFDEERFRDLWSRSIQMDL